MSSLKKYSAYNAPEPAPLTGEAKQIADRLEKAFLDFRAANDERLAAVEKLGTETPELRAKVDKANDDIDKIRDSLDKALDQLTAIRAGGGGDDKERNALETQARQFIASVRRVEPERITGDDVERYCAYAKAFPAFLRKGVDPIRAEMQVGSDPDGGYWVPTQMQTTVLRRLFETSPMRQVASQLTITGADSVAWPTDTNDGTSGGWVGEQDTRAETDTPQVGEQTIYLREQYAMPQATQKLLDMSTIDVEAWLSGKIADKLARTENTAFVSGTGVSQPRGFLDYKSAAVTTDDASRAWGVLQYTVSGASAGFPTASGIAGASDPDALITMHSKMKPVYLPGASWMMNRSVQAALRKLKDGDGNYFIGTIVNAAAGFELLGLPIVTAEDMPNLGADSFSIALGNWGMGYQIIDGPGLRVLRDNLTTKGKVKFYTTKWTGGDVINFDAIKLMKFGTS